MARVPNIDVQIPPSSMSLPVLQARHMFYLAFFPLATQQFYTEQQDVARLVSMATRAS